uniref:ATP synthase F0 subunit 8 n=1 Tax=Bostrychia moritziana TaxID=103713 RepID=UPI002E75B16F|nr:ATP synthase F0 subunit 8 [Bostrychia moritziana]WQF69402.1 ATP synthase F0 subunit 8 [Bostrychia moritziana]
MPQLDILLIIPQITWLFLNFVLFYFLITFFILPKFLKVIKLRKLIVLENKALNSTLSESYFSKRKIMIAKFNSDLKKIKFSILDKIFVSTFFENKKKFLFLAEFNKITNCLKSAAKHTICYCNTNLLNSLLLFPISSKI